MRAGGGQGGSLLPPCALLGDEAEVEPSSAHCERGWELLDGAAHAGHSGRCFATWKGGVQGGECSILNRTNGGMLYIRLE